MVKKEQQKREMLVPRLNIYENIIIIIKLLRSPLRLQQKFFRPKIKFRSSSIRSIGLLLFFFNNFLLDHMHSRFYSYVDFLGQARVKYINNNVSKNLYSIITSAGSRFKT